MFRRLFLAAAVAMTFAACIPEPTPPAYTHEELAFIAWVDSIVAPTGDLWDRVAVCETGGYQGAPPGVANWSMKGSTYSGGLGFANTTWSAYRYEWMPANAGDANREEQILVAERVRWELRPYGSLRGKWPACSVRLGTP